MIDILVVGDPILDRYWYGTPKGISPEAPIVTWNIENVEDRLGGAANVVNNLINLSGKYGDKKEIAFISCFPKDLLSTVTKDFPLKSIISDKKPTIKNRIIFTNPHQQIIRFDEDNNFPMTKREENSLVEKIRSIKAKVGIVSDYAHGSITHKILNAVRDSCEIVLIDPKGLSPDKYTGIANIITPNRKELNDLVQEECDELTKIKKLHQILTDDTDIELSVILKCSEDGCIVMNSEYEFYAIEPYRISRTVIDPTGAGDTFIATLAFMLSEDISIKFATEEANRLAGISVTYPNCWVPTDEYI